MDRFRTAALTVNVGEYSAGFNLFTGSRTNFSGDEAEMLNGLQYGRYGEKMPNGFVKEDGHPFRLGVAYFSYKNFRVGVNSDRYVRHPIQDIIAHGFFQPQPGFYSYSNTVIPFFQYRTPNIFTSW